MLVSAYKDFVKKVARELRNKSIEEQNRRLQQLVEDIKKEVKDGINKIQV